MVTWGDNAFFQQRVYEQMAAYQSLADGAAAQLFNNPARPPRRMDVVNMLDRLKQQRDLMAGLVTEEATINASLSEGETILVAAVSTNLAAASEEINYAIALLEQAIEPDTMFAAFTSTRKEEVLAGVKLDESFAGQIHSVLQLNDRVARGGGSPPDLD